MNGVNTKPINIIEIWQPRYKDNTVLVATYKVKSGYNYIKFTKAPHLEGKLYRFHSTDIDTNNVQQNGKAVVYVIPMAKLELADDSNEEVKEEPINKKFKIDIGGISREFDSAEDFVNALAEFLGKGEK